MNEKRGGLSGGASTDEAVLSSPSVLSPNQAGQFRGLQQYFTPPAAAAWIASITGRGVVSLDLMAGDGSLLAPVSEALRFGVEVDKDQVAAAKKGGRPYHAISGDVQQVYPLLAAAGVKFDSLLLNPPFGISWDIKGLGRGNSAVLTAKMGLALLDTGGIGALVCGAERFDREVRAEFGDRLVAVVRVEKMFPGTGTPCAIAFFGSAGPYGYESVPHVLDLAVGKVSDLDQALTDRVLEHEGDHFGYRRPRHGDSYIPYAEQDSRKNLESLWATVDAEHRRRQSRRPRADGVTMRGAKIHVLINAFSEISLARVDRGLSAWIKTFDGQPASYFALRRREWPRLQRVCAEHEVPLSEAVTKAVSAALERASRATKPLYPVPPTQRLAFLADLESITCRKTSQTEGFVAGEVYAISCETHVNSRVESRVQETMEGPELYKVVVESRALRIQIGEKKYDEAPESMRFILEHFEVPDPGDLASEHGADVQYWEEILRRVEREIQAREVGFRFRTFQIKDLARLLVKVSDGLGGLLAWEMGLGKALAQGAVARALELAGRLPDGCALFTMPQDLVPQFSKEMHRFFGVDLLPVGHAGRRAARAAPGGFSSTAEPAPKTLPGAVSAVRCAEMVDARRRWVRERGGPEVQKVWAITWFEALAISGRDHEALPVRNVVAISKCVSEATEAHYDFHQGRTIPARAAVFERVMVDSTVVCPRCRADREAGWDGEVCRALLRDVDGDAPDASPILAERRRCWGAAAGDTGRGPRVCGYVHRRVLRKPAYRVLCKSFRYVAVDEGTKIQGDSAASRAVRAFKPPFRVLCTGTPLKNYVHQMFWLLWWALGDSSASFPYGYRGGQEKFLADFGVTECRFDDGRRKKETGARPRVLPEVSNLLYLWKMLCGAVVRRRMEEVGAVVSTAGDWTCPSCSAKAHLAMEGGWKKPASLTCGACGAVADAIVPLTYRPVTVPWGVTQLRHYQHWLNRRKFATWFLDTHPNSPLHGAKDPVGIAELLAASIGQLAKLEYASTDPTGDEHWEGPSAWTPCRLAAMRAIEKAVGEGKQVLYGSCLVAPGPWMAKRLCERGINAVHLTDEDQDGHARTISPKARSKAVADFRAGKIQVLCTSINSMSLGHNLDNACVAILEGPPWDFLTLAQWINRIRRLTSQWPIEVQIFMPSGSLPARKWELLQKKTAASDLALDGKIADRVEEQVDKAQVLKELIEQGIRADGTEVNEDDVRAAWYGERRAA